MQKGLWVVAICSVVLNFFFICQQYTRTRVVSVPDGDSLQLSDGRRVRLLGIDAPERDRCLASEAREELRRLALGKHVRLKDIVTDDYGRVLSIVIVWPNIVVNREMLVAGLARNTFSASNDYKAMLKEAYDEAKTKKIGIFSSTCRTAPTDCLIKGNVRDGKKMYHVQGCDNYSQVIVDEAFGDQWFCTEGEAQAAGFTKAGGCRK